MSVTSKWRCWLRTRSKAHTSRKPVRLGIEALEDRAVPAALRLPVQPQVPLTLIVTSAADSGAGTLREALDQANANAATADTIQFAANLQGATINLSTVASNTYGPSALDVKGPVTIIGSGQTIEPAPFSPNNLGPTAFRLFAVEPKATLNLQNLTLANGFALGGTGYNGGGGAAGLGGAIYNCGELDLIACTLDHNSAVGGNARITALDYNYGGGGGLGGNADAQGGGGGPHGGLAPDYKVGTDVYGYPQTYLAAPATNGGFGGGGGAGGYLDGLNGGGVQSEADGRNGGFGGGGGGAGVYQYGNGYFDPAWFGVGGVGGFGGGGGAGADANGNGGQSDFGGGAGSGAVDGLLGNGGGGAGMGGAVFNQGGTVKAVNSTFALNAVKGGDSVATKSNYVDWSFNPINFPQGNGGSAFGAGLFNLNGTMTLVNCTLASNDATAGKGLNWGFAAGTAVTNASHNAGLPLAGPNASPDANLNVYNDILIGAAGPAVVYNFGDLKGNAQVNGAFNLLSSPVSDFGGATTLAAYSLGNIQLGPLQNNGGPTPTMLPPASTPLGSTFYFASLNLPGGVPANDQRGAGYNRVVNNQVNLGAVQVQANRVAPTPPRIMSRASGSVSNAVSDTAIVDLLFALQQR